MRLVRGKRSPWTAAPARAALPRSGREVRAGRKLRHPAAAARGVPGVVLPQPAAGAGPSPLWFSGSLPGSLETEADREVSGKEGEASAAWARGPHSCRAGKPFSQRSGLEFLPKRSQQGRRPLARSLDGRKAPGLPSVGTVSFKGSGPN